MYTLDEIEFSEYDGRSYNKKYSKWSDIQHAKLIGKKVVLFVTMNKYDTVERYRVEHFLEVLDSNEEWCAISITEMELIIAYHYLDLFDVIVFTRIKWDIYIDDFICKCNQKSIAMVYSIDDLVTDESKIDTIMEGTGVYNRVYWLSEVESNNRVASECDALWTTNDFLAAELQKQYNKPVFITDNFMNREQEAVADKCYLRKVNMDRDESLFIIGFFSGSPTHVNDFSIVANALLGFLNNHEDTRLEIVGSLELPDSYNEIVNEEKVIRRTFMNPCDLQIEMAKVDVNILPMVINEFTQCKSPIRYFEPAMSGTMSLMSNSYIYESIFKSGGEGIVCSDEKQWSEALELVYNNEDNIIKRNMLSLHDFAKANYSINVQEARVQYILNEMYSLKISK